MNKVVEYNIPKMLIVGPGGTGMKVLSRIQSHFVNKFDGLNYNNFYRKSPVQLVAWDAQLDAVKEEHDEKITLHPLFEQFPIRISDLKSTIRIMEKDPNYPYLHRRHRDNFPPFDVSDNIGAGQGKFGVGMNRLIARALIQKGSNDLYRDGIKPAIDRLMNLPKTIELGNALCHIDDKQLYIVYVGSLAGGVGSGSFLNLPYHINNKIKLHENIRDNVCCTGIFATHSSYISSMTNPKRIKRARANCYAAMKEISYGMNGCPLPMYSSDGCELVSMKDIYHSLFLFDRGFRNNGRAIDGLLEGMAQYCFLIATSSEFCNAFWSKTVNNFDVKHSVRSGLPSEHFGYNSVAIREVFNSNTIRLKKILLEEDVYDDLVMLIFGKALEKEDDSSSLLKLRYSYENFKFDDYSKTPLRDWDTEKVKKDTGIPKQNLPSILKYDASNGEGAGGKNKGAVEKINIFVSNSNEYQRWYKRVGNFADSFKNAQGIDETLENFARITLSREASGNIATMISDAVYRAIDKPVFKGLSKNPITRFCYKQIIEREKERTKSLLGSLKNIGSGEFTENLKKYKETVETLGSNLNIGKKESALNDYIQCLYNLGESVKSIENKYYQIIISREIVNKCESSLANPMEGLEQKVNQRFVSSVINMKGKINRILNHKTMGEPVGEDEDTIRKNLENSELDLGKMLIENFPKDACEATEIKSLLEPKETDYLLDKWISGTAEVILKSVNYGSPYDVGTSRDLFSIFNAKDNTQAWNRMGVEVIEHLMKKPMRESIAHDGEAKDGQEDFVLTGIETGEGAASKTPEAFLDRMNSETKLTYGDNERAVFVSVQKGIEPEQLERFNKTCLENYHELKNKNIAPVHVFEFGGYLPELKEKERFQEIDNIEGMLILLEKYGDINLAERIAKKYGFVGASSEKEPNIFGNNPIVTLLEKSFTKLGKEGNSIKNSLIELPFNAKLEATRHIDKYITDIELEMVSRMQKWETDEPKYDEVLLNVISKNLAGLSGDQNHWQEMENQAFSLTLKSLNKISEQFGSSTGLNKKNQINNKEIVEYAENLRKEMKALFETLKTVLRNEEVSWYQTILVAISKYFGLEYPFNFKESPDYPSICRELADSLNDNRSKNTGLWKKAYNDVNVFLGKCDGNEELMKLLTENEKNNSVISENVSLIENIVTSISDIYSEADENVVELEYIEPLKYQLERMLLIIKSIRREGKSRIGTDLYAELIDEQSSLEALLVNLKTVLETEMNYKNALNVFSRDALRVIVQKFRGDTKNIVRRDISRIIPKLNENSMYWLLDDEFVKRLTDWKERYESSLHMWGEKIHENLPPQKLLEANELDIGISEFLKKLDQKLETIIAPIKDGKLINLDNILKQLKSLKNLHEKFLSNIKEKYETENSASEHLDSPNNKYTLLSEFLMNVQQTNSDIRSDLLELIQECKNIVLQNAECHKIKSLEWIYLHTPKVLIWELAQTAELSKYLRESWENLNYSDRITGLYDIPWSTQV